MNISLPNINTNYAGFSSFIDMYNKINECTTGEALTINMPSWFSANMCSPFGAILGLARDSKRVESVTLQIGNKDVLDILKKNNFLYLVGYPIKPLRDVYDNAIIYRVFFRNESCFFNKYIENNLIRRLPPMSNSLNKVFKNSIFEIFQNAVIHSETKTIFVCGQRFHNKKNVNFSITDTGVGFHKKITSFTGLCLTPIEAIEWAIQGNTTKKGPIPGGSGLKLIKEFITDNNGKMQIASDCGYWELSNGVIKTRAFSAPFPGSVVNIEIDTTDACAYNLQNKVELNNIF